MMKPQAKQPSSYTAEEIKAKFAAVAPPQYDEVNTSSKSVQEVIVVSEGMADTSRMNTVSREELNAKLELIETKLDAKVQRIEDKIDAFTEASKETQDSVKSLKSTVVVTGISSVLAIVLGVAAFNATVLSNMVASFESGKSTATSLSQTQEQLQQREQRLNEIEKKLDTLISSKPAK